jgi:hypothetical protein
LSLVEVELCMFLTWVAIVHSIDANGGLIFDLYVNNKFNNGFFAQIGWVGLSFRYVAKEQTLSRYYNCKLKIFPITFRP